MPAGPGESLRPLRGLHVAMRLLLTIMMLLLQASRRRHGASAAAAGRQGIGATADASALLRLRAVMLGWNETYFRGRNLTLVDWNRQQSGGVCEWDGVWCNDAGRVFSVTVHQSCDDDGEPLNALVEGCHHASLPAFGPLEALTPALEALPALHHLDLRGLGLTGSLPDSWAAPGGLLSRLADIDLKNNQVEGDFMPASWLAGPQATRSQQRQQPEPVDQEQRAEAGLPDAASSRDTDCWPTITINLSDNRLRGTLPPTLMSAGAFCNLFNLDLKNNQLRGGLPISWLVDERGINRQLGTLVLANNPLGGLLPEFPTESSAQMQRQGHMEDEAAEAPCLHSVNLSNCSFEGPLPRSWGHAPVFSGLAWLDLSRNKLSGTIPAEWLQSDTPTRPLALELWNNRLQGLLPAGLVQEFSGTLGVLPGNEGLCMVPPTKADRQRHEELQLLQAPSKSLHLRRNPWRPFVWVHQCRPTQFSAGDQRSSSQYCDIRPADLPACPSTVLPGAAGFTTRLLVASAVGVAALLAGGLLAARRLQRREQCRGLDNSLWGGVWRPLHDGSSPHSRSSTLGIELKDQGEPALMSVCDFEEGLEPAVLGSMSSVAGLLGSRPRRHPLHSTLRSRSQQPRQLVETWAAVAAPPSFAHASLWLSSLGQQQQQPQQQQQWSVSLSGGAAGPSASARGISGSWWLQSSSLRLQRRDIELYTDGEGELHVLGAGGFSWVIAGLLYGRLPVAVKAIHSEHAMEQPATPGQQLLRRHGPTASQRFWRECAILRRCQHENVVQLLGVYCSSGGQAGRAELAQVSEEQEYAEPHQEAADADPGAAAEASARGPGQRAHQEPRLLLIVTELLLGGTLLSRLHDAEMRWYHRGAHVALDIARALAFLHSVHVVHFDVKAANVLLSTGTGHAKLTDAGQARLFEDEGSVRADGLTLMYSSPEQALNLSCGPPSDLFSFGCLLWELIKGQKLTRRGMFEPLKTPEECPASIAELIARCLQTSPELRPTATEAERVILLSMQQCGTQEAQSGSGGTDPGTSAAEAEMLHSCSQLSSCGAGKGEEEERLIASSTPS